MKAQELYNVINIMQAKINDIIGKGTRGVHFGGQRELFAAIASIEELYDLSYAEAEDRRPLIMNIMINAMLEEQTTGQIIQSLKLKGLNDENAGKVAFTEESRIKNLANWYQYYGAGYKFFSVKFTEDACEECKEAYKDDKKYSIEQLDILPPLHGECKCDLMFHRK